MASVNRAVALSLVAVVLHACAGTVVQPLLGMRDVAVSSEHARTLTRIALVPVQLRPALVAAAQGARWDDVALVNDDLLLEALQDLARSLNASGVHHARVADQGIIVHAEATREPQMMLDAWLKADAPTAPPAGHVSSADAVIELAWSSFPPPLRHVMVGTRLIDARSGRVLGRAMRLILDEGFPPSPEHARNAFRSGAEGVGLSTR